MSAAAGGDPNAALFEAADRCYADGHWAQAAFLYGALQASHPDLANSRGVAIALGHCHLETRDDIDPIGLGGDAVSLVGEPARLARSGAVRYRALALCRAGAFTRAGRLLLFLAKFDPHLASAFTENFAKPRSGCWEAYPEGSAYEPGFLRANPWSDAGIAAMKDRCRALKVLLVLPWTTAYSVGDNYARSARNFGLTVHALDFVEMLGELDPDAAATRLQGQIDALRPDVILCASFVEIDLKADMIERLSAVLEAARMKSGARVVAISYDAWRPPAHRVTSGLGRSLDLVHHCHPALTQNPDLDGAGVYCYFHPTVLPQPTVAPATIPRALASGSFTFANPSRLLWWAQIGMSDLPFDFVETSFQGAAMLPAERYADLLCEHQLTVGLTRRASGVAIVTMRSLETLAAGGVLLEENSFDTRYFLKPGTHYVPFETWADLCELIPWLLDNPEYRKRLAHHGQAWVRRHFSGDWFWAGLLRRVFP